MRRMRMRRVTGRARCCSFGMSSATGQGANFYNEQSLGGATKGGCHDAAASTDAGAAGDHAGAYTLRICSRRAQP